MPVIQILLIGITWRWRQPKQQDCIYVRLILIRRYCDQSRFHQSCGRESLEWIFWLTDTEWSGTRACTEMRNIRHQTPPLTYYKNGAPPHKFFEECACRVQIGVDVKWRRKLLELQPEHLVQARSPNSVCRTTAHSTSSHMCWHYAGM